MSSNKKTNANAGSPAGTKLVLLVPFPLPMMRLGSIEATSTNHWCRDTKIETSVVVSPISGAASQPLDASPSTPTGSGTSAPRPVATPIQPTTSAAGGGGSGARSPEIQRALSGQHDYSWYTDNFHLAKTNNIIAADNAERQRSASLVAASPEPPKNEKEEKGKGGTAVSNLENKKPVFPGKGAKADDSKGSGCGR